MRFTKRVGAAWKTLFGNVTVVQTSQGGHSDIAPIAGYNQWSDDSFDTRDLQQKLQGNLYTLRRVSRNLYQDSPLYKRFVMDSVNQVVGSQPLLFEFPQLSQRTREDLKAKWLEWQGRRMTPRGQNFTELLKSALYHRIVDGDCLIRLLRNQQGQTDFVLYPGDGFAETVTGVNYSLGIEVGTYNRAVAYWVWKDYFTSNRSYLGAFSREQERLTRANAIHFLEMDLDASAVRGHPHAHSVLYLIDQLRSYEASMITRMKRQSQPYVALRQNIGTGGVTVDGSVEEFYKRQNFTGEVSNTATNNDPLANFNHARTVDNGFGKQFVLPSGYDPVQISTGTTSGEDVPFIREHLVKMIASGLGVSDITLASGFDKANFSSAQMATLREIELWRRWQSLLERLIVRRIFRIFLDEIQFERAVSPKDLDLLYGNNRIYPTFSWRRVQVLEAHRMIGALQQGVTGNIYSLREARESLGLSGNIKDHAAEIAAEKEIFEDLGLKQASPIPEDPEEDDEDEGEDSNNEAQDEESEEGQENMPESKKSA